MFYICLTMCFICCICIASIVISPENSIALRWAKLNKDRKTYGIMFYALLVLDIVSCYSFFKAQYSSFIFTIIHLVVCLGLLFLTMGAWSLLKSSELPNEILSPQAKSQPESEKTTLARNDTITEEDTPDTADDIEKQVFRDIFQTSHKPRIFRSSPDFDMRLDETGQYDRYHRAVDCRIISIDYNKNSAIFKGTSEPQYKVTLDSCTCMDFQRRHRPCKHMYRLAHELGCCTIEGCPRGVLYDPNDIMEKYTIDAAKELIQKMNTEEQKELYGLVRQWISSSRKEWIYASDEPLSNRLVDDGFLEEITAPVDTILRLFSIADLRAVLKNAGVKCPRSKEETIQEVIELGMEHYVSLYSKYKLVKFDDNYKPIRGKIRSFLKMLVGEYYEYPDDGEYYDYDLPTIHAIR